MQNNIETALQAQGYEPQWKWKVIECRPAPWSTDGTRRSFYVKAEPIVETGTPQQETKDDFAKALALTFDVTKTSATQGDPYLHHVLNFPTAQHEEAFAQLAAAGKFAVISARYVNLKIGLTFAQRWSMDSNDGRFKAGEFVMNPTTNTPREYDTVRASVLCDGRGMPIEDPIRKCRNKYNGNVQNGVYVPYDALAMNTAPMAQGTGDPMQKAAAAAGLSGVQFGNPIVGTTANVEPPTAPQPAQQPFQGFQAPR